MKIRIIFPLVVLTAALSACGGKKSAPLTGTWKVVGMDLKPDSLVKPGMFDIETLKKVRFKFDADSSVTISDGGTNSSTAKYSIETTNNESFLVMKPTTAPAPNPEMPAPPPEQRMRIVNHTSDKLDLEQKFDPYTFTTHLEPVR